MSIDAIGSLTYAYEDSSSLSTGSDALDFDAFLKLLITQLQNQNPLEPMKDTEFIAQMAQFSALEQMSLVREEVEGLREDIAEELSQLNDSLGGLTGSNAALGLRALDLIGKQVKAEVDGVTVEGTVSGVKNFNSLPILVVGEQEILLDSVLEVLLPQE